MDIRIFEQRLEHCQTKLHDIECLEIYAFSEPMHNTTLHINLPEEKLYEWLNRKREFAQPCLPMPEGVTQIGVLRLIVQIAPPTIVQKAEAYPTPPVISLSKEHYLNMFKTLRLPYLTLESEKIVGQFYWSTLDKEDSLFQLVYRQSEIQGASSGPRRTLRVEIIISHQLKTGITSGYIKATDPIISHVYCKSIFDDLFSYNEHAAHPMLLLAVVLHAQFNTGMNNSTDMNHRQRRTRDELAAIEDTLKQTENRTNLADMAELMEISKRLITCNSKVLVKGPKDYKEVISGFIADLDNIAELVPDGRRHFTQKDHKMLKKISNLWKAKIDSMASFAEFTVRRVDMQRDLLNVLFAQAIALDQLQNAKAKEERGIKRDRQREQEKNERATEKEMLDQIDKERNFKLSRTQTTISLLGIFFLPGTFISSLFATTFFDFRAETNGQIVSPRFWIYWCTTVPATLLVLAIWYSWEEYLKAKRRGKQRKISEDSEMMGKGVNGRRNPTNIQGTSGVKSASENEQVNTNGIGAEFKTALPSAVSVPQGDSGNS